ncbi:TetR/AcrR family transcriptional regulator [Desulfosarcina sp.]|uniref:TetR/AcrR family transcriptional regulator n=1 Tax=Desulfosarcina sp. TaxID=2027861 RepID=UPI003569A28F
MNLKKGRTNQKLRTRKALLEAADRLVGQGVKPSIADIAEKALVSKATAYRYFPNLDALLLELSLDRKVAAPEQILHDAEELSAAERAARVHDFLHRLVAENEQQFRLFLRASMEQWLQTGGKSDAPLRGARRIPMLSLALAPCRKSIDQATYRKLLHALCALVSLEAFITLTDVCQIEPDEGKEITRWAVKTLVNAVLKP